MKKNIFKPLLFIAALFIFTNNVQAQSGNKITISVKDIQYDDPNFAALRESLKKNPKVKLVKPSYVAGVAILSFNYAGEAPQLWEEIPKTSKRFFALVEMGDDAITLNYLNPKTNSGNSTVVTNTPQTKTTNQKDCFDCDYFPMCAYDETLSFGGKEYRGWRDVDGSLSYYYCEKGEVTKIWDYTVNVIDDYLLGDHHVEERVGNMVIMKSNVPVGATWTGGAAGDMYYSFTLSAKGAKVLYKDKTYSDVIKIQANEDYYYYAKNVGYLGTNLTEVGTPSSFAPFKLGAKDLAASCKNWCGTWRLVEDNGKKFLPDDVTPYMQLLDDGDGATFSLQIKPDKKLHLIGKGVALTWGPWSEQAGTINYINYNAKYQPSEKGLAINSKSVPLQILIIGTRTYKYYGDDISFSE